MDNYTKYYNMFLKQTGNKELAEKRAKRKVKWEEEDTNRYPQAYKVMGVKSTEPKDKSNEYLREERSGGTGK